MNCLKCGMETPDPHVFCDSCRMEMEKYPVKPDTPVQLPLRSAPEAARRVPKRKAPPKPEEQIPRLKRLIRRLTAAVCVLVLLLGILVVVAVEYSRRQPKPVIGQNYNTVQSTTP